MIAPIPEAAPHKRLLSYDEAGQLIGVCGKSIYNAARAGKLRVVKLGRLVRVDPQDLDAYIEANKTTV